MGLIEVILIHDDPDLFFSHSIYPGSTSPVLEFERINVAPFVGAEPISLHLLIWQRHPADKVGNSPVTGNGSWLILVIEITNNHAAIGLLGVRQG